MNYAPWLPFLLTDLFMQGWPKSNFIRRPLLPLITGFRRFFKISYALARSFDRSTYASLAKNPSPGSEDNADKQSYVDHDRISTKTNMSTHSFGCKDIILTIRFRDISFFKQVHMKTVYGPWWPCFLTIGLNKKFQRKIVNIFLPIIFSICFGCSKEPSHLDSSFNYPQHMFWLRNKKIMFLVCTLN